ncbi:hypothetical protein HK104_001432 [Borealophlyctis nickersoniae]|nr:hypothetical protein HK104_001432 [Borealophlyctis nickersoniae]
MRRNIFPPLTRRQALQLLLMHSIGAGILDAIINFGVATAVFKGQPDTRLWALPNSIAGAAVVTVIIQETLTWVLDGGLAWGEVRKGVLLPIYPEETARRRGWSLPRKGLAGWICRGSLDVFGPLPNPDLPLRSKILKRLGRVLVSASRGCVLGLIVALPAAAVAVGIAVAVWPGLASGDPVSGFPGPQIFSAIYTFFLGVILTPLSTITAMAQAGECGAGPVKLGSVGSVSSAEDAETGSRDSHSDNFKLQDFDGPESRGTEGGPNSTGQLLGITMPESAYTASKNNQIRLE